MKTYKKILIGVLFTALFFVSWILSAPTSSAQTLSDAVKCWQSLRFEDIAHVVCEVSDGSTVSFTDPNPTDEKGNGLDGYPFHKSHYGPDSDNIFSDCSRIGDVNGSPDYRYGISAKRDSTLSIADANQPVEMLMNIGYTQEGSTGCIRYGGNGGRDITLSDSRTNAIRYYYSFAGTNIGPLEGVNDGELEKTYLLISKIGAKRADGLYRLGFARGGWTTCSGEVVIVSTNGGRDSAIANRYELSDGSFTQQQFPDLYSFLTDNKIRECGAKLVQPISSGGTRAFHILGTPPPFEETPDPGDNIGTGVAGTPSCEKNFSSVFAYFLCPALDLADSAAGVLFGFVERQLCFDTGSSSTGGVNCPGDSILTNEIKASWSAFRTIATALLILIMLVMVFAQAFSIGPFDPYTVRKILPRILAAVILIQLSWVMLKFFIDLSNDVGSGIAELMFAPFGGIDNMRLDDLIGNKVNTATGGSNAANSAFAVFAVLAAGALTIANLPGLFALAFFAVVALFLAFAILIVRKLLIILLVLVAPLAFIAWILPAGESYWKNWKDNFIKLLLMFPMIMALIAAGRIMANVASKSAVLFPPPLAVANVGPLPIPYFADVSSFVGLAIIMIAFFAPYFLILKTFSWAGGLMGIISRGALSNRMMRNIQEKGGERVGGFTERMVTGRFAKKYDPNKGILSRTGNSIMGGRLIPTKYRQAVLTQRGDKWAEERNAEAGSYVGRGAEKAQGGYDIYDMRDGKFGRFRRHEGATTTDAKGNEIKAGDLLDAEGNKADKLTAQFTETATKAEAFKRTATGVEAMKQFLVDSSGLEGSDALDRRAQAAHKMLLDTSSEIELQGSYIQNGKHQGKRATEVPIFDSTLSSSPQHYSHIIRSRSDFAPDVKQSAEAKASKELGREVTYDNTPATDVETRRVLDKHRLTTAIERLSPESLQSQHYGFYDDIARINDEGLSRTLKDKLTDFWQNGGQPGNVAVGALRGAKQEHVDKALGVVASSLDAIQGRVGISGEVRIAHENLDTSDAHGVTPRQTAYAEDAARDEYRRLHSAPRRTQEQQQRYQQYRSQHPDWNPGPEPPPLDNRP